MAVSVSNKDSLSTIPFLEKCCFMYGVESLVWRHQNQNRKYPQLQAKVTEERRNIELKKLNNDLDFVVISFWKNSTWKKIALFRERFSDLEPFSLVFLACTCLPNPDSPETFLS